MAHAFRRGGGRRSRDGGCPLTRSLAPLDRDRLRALLPGVPERALVVLDRADSTNDEARRLAATGADEGTVVIAEAQTAGRGRFGRRWDSPRGLGLYVTVLCRPRRPASELPRWGIAAAAAACLAAREAGAAEVFVEWPNDLVWRGLKIGGTLAEARSTSGVPPDLVVGTGLNVGHVEKDFPVELRGRAASLLMARGGRETDRERLAASYLSKLFGFSADLAAGRFDAVLSAWLPLAPGAEGCRVRVAAGDGASVFLGTTRGLHEAGGLRVEKDDGSVEIVRATGAVTFLEA